MDQICICAIETEATNKRENLRKTALDIFLSILILASGILAFLTAFQVTYIKEILFVALIFCPLLFRFLYQKFSEQMICIYLLFAAAGVGTVFYRQIWNGLLLVINQIFYVLNDRNGFSHVPYETSIEVGQEGIYGTMALVFIIVLLSVGVALGVRHRQAIVVFAFTAPFLLFGICCLIKPDIPALIIYVLSWVLFVALCRISEKKNKVIIVSRNKGGFIGAVSLAVVVAVVVGCGVTYLCLPRDADQLLGITGGAKNQIETFADRIRYESNTDIYQLPMGDLRNIESALYTGNIAMTVTMEKPSSVYLRGFIGGEYENNQWTDVDRAKYSEDYAGIFEWLYYNGFHPQTQTGNLVSAANETEAGRITIENIALNSKYIYAPYEALTGMDLEEGAVQYTQDTEIMSKGILGARDYSFDMYLPQTDDYGSADLAAWLSGLTIESQTYADYSEKENVYKTFVYQTYLDISEQEDTNLKEFLTEETVDSLDGREYRTIITEIRQRLNEDFVFSYDIDKMGENEDFIEHFLETGEGYDVHFATLAVMILRQAGVPARYAEGYYIAPLDIEIYTDVNDIIFDLSDDYAHAWAEVYVDGVGWLPIEVTPGYYTLPEDEDSNDGVSERVERTPTYYNPTEEDVPVEQEDSSEPAGATSNYLWLILMIVAILLIAMILVYLIAGRYYKKRRMREFLQENTTDAAISMYRYFTRLLAFEKMKIDNTAAYEVLEAAKEGYDITAGLTLKQFLDTVYKARYSAKDRLLGSEEMTCLLTYITGISSLIYSRQKRHRELLMRLLWLRVSLPSFENLKDD